ncbi:MAG: PHP domain-containing protein [Verrucomicrobiota bacterium]
MNAATTSRRFVLGATGIGLLALSLCALLPINPQGPFDARDNTRLPGMRLETSASAAFIEPLAAPLRIVAGAPDFRLATLSCLVWVICGAALWRAGSDLRTQRPGSIRTRILRAATTAGQAGGVLALWIAFGVTVRLPGWRLVVDDPHALIVDLHSHTYGSHDAFVSGPTNLAWHAAAGCNGVAITEHGDPAAAFATDLYANTATGSSPAVIPGLELAVLTRGQHLLALGLQPDYQTPPGRMAQDFPARYMTYIHSAQHGAVIAMGYKLHPEDASVLADAGVDAFEFTNQGHPNVSNAVRKAMLEVAAKRGIPLVASSDWHGYGGILRTWTVIRTSAVAATLSPQQKSMRVVEKLRERATADIIPVVAGSIGPPSRIRAVFSPFAEVLRYAAELSLAQVLAWWVWAAILLGITQLLGRVGLPARQVLPALLLGVLAGGLLWAGLALVAVNPNGLIASGFPRHIGTYTLLLGSLALIAGGWTGRCAWLERRRPAPAVTLQS